VSALRHGAGPPRGTAEEPWREGPGLIASLWRHRVLVVVVTLLAAVAGYGISLLQAPTYRATSQVF